MLQVVNRYFYMKRRESISKISCSSSRRESRDPLDREVMLEIHILGLWMPASYRHDMRFLDS
jgi:hypothetical protein